MRACFGYVRDLPIDRMGVDVEHGFAAEYVVPAAKADVVKRLKAEAGSATAVLLASDPDREGEAIAWHLVAALGLKSPGALRRISFHEITREAILKVVQQPRAIDRHLVDAQQARRILDRLIGYPVSQVLGRTIRRGLSAGRVQSVAVRSDANAGVATAAGGESSNEVCSLGHPMVIRDGRFGRFRALSGLQPVSGSPGSAASAGAARCEVSGLRQQHRLETHPDRLDVLRLRDVSSLQLDELVPSPV